MIYSEDFSNGKEREEKGKKHLREGNFGMYLIMTYSTDNGNDFADEHKI